MAGVVRSLLRRDVRQNMWRTTGSHTGSEYHPLLPHAVAPHRDAQPHRIRFADKR